ncbi:MAG: alpha/beta hydrolase [Dehalococcoidia bacterium]
MTTNGQEKSQRRRRFQLAAVLGASLLVVAMASLAVAGWYFSERFERDVLAVEHAPDAFPLRVLSLTDGRLTLDASDTPDGDWARPGVYGVEWATGYGQVGEIIALDARTVTRQFTLLTGEFPAPGDAARTDTLAFPRDPELGLGLSFDEVLVTGPLGDMPAWLVDAPSPTWAVLVHGKGARRTEMLRLVSILHDRGITCLVITYRNDVEAPADPDHRYHLGNEEWRDVEAAVAYAIDHGASGVVLVGHSMGGGAVMAFLERSAAADRIAAVVLDSPLLNVERTVRWRARDLAPGPVIRYGMWVSAIRFGLDWGDYDYLSGAGRVSVPMLIFHGDADASVPIETSQELVERLPDLVTLVSWPGVRHVQSWNRDPAAYGSQVTRFLGAVPGIQP